MKKTLSKILVSLCMLGVFLLPLTPEISHAQETNDWYFSFLSTDGDSFTDVGPFTETVCKGYKVGDQVVTGGDTNYINYIKQITSPCEKGAAGNSLNQATAGSITKSTEIDFGCNWYLPFTPSCLLSLIYHVIFVPLAWITTGAAKILDYFVYYSTSDASYRNVFVEKGWGTVRDIANVMFIIGLLFIAIKTILGINTTNNKKMLGNIIIFALLINFSLFATQVIVDASNILAKVFYHQITPVDSNGQKIEGNVEQRSVTVGIVDKFRPQELLRAGTNSVGDIDLSNQTALSYLVIFLLIALMGFMIYIFISVSFLFVARTVSIWLAMILAPVAFASQAIDPHIKGLGWSEWLSNLLKSAFMAPIFIFFLYIIILFGDLFAIGGVSATGGEDTNIAAFMATFIPFMLIFVLLRQAKSLAVTYSGEMGKAISTGAVAIGGLALGGAAMGTAFAGRQIGGRIAAGAAKSQDSMHYARARMDHDKEIDEWQKNGKVGDKPKLEDTWLKYKQDHFNKSGKVLVNPSAWTKFGASVNYNQMKSGKIDHARHDMDTYMKKSGLEGRSMSNLSGAEIERVENEFKKDKRSEIETSIKRGDKDSYIHGEEGTLRGTADASGDRIVYKTEAEYRQGEREKVTNDLASRGITDKDAINLELNVRFDKALKESFESVSKEKFDHTITESKKSVGPVGNVMANASSGSYDVRDLTKIKADGRQKGLKGISTIAAAGLISAIAGAVRLGVKKGAGMEAGKSNADFAKDIATLIKDSLNIKIDLGGGSGGGGGGHAKPSGGGGGHGGGH